MIFKGIISLCGHCKRQCITHLLPPLPSTKGNKEVAVQPVEIYCGHNNCSYQIK